MTRRHQPSFQSASARVLRPLCDATRRSCSDGKRRLNVSRQMRAKPVEALGLAEGHSPPHRLGEQEKNRAEQGLEWRARETRINRRFRSSREQGSNAAWLAFLGLPAARRMDDTYGRGHRNNTLREHDRGTQSTHSRGGYPLRHGRLLAR